MRQRSIDWSGKDSRLERGRTRSAAVRVAALLVAGVASAQVSPNGPQFQVNTYTPGAQWHAAVAVNDQGNFVLAWQSVGSSGTDTSDTSIQAQRYDVNGAPVGLEFQVNTQTTGHQNYPAVAAGDQGDFVVAWESESSIDTDTDSLSIQAQRFDASGAPIGEEFQVNTYTTSWQRYPAVSMDDQGSFVVAWASHGSSGTDTSYWSIQAQRYDPNGAPVGGEFQVNTYATLSQTEPKLAADSQGNFLVAWQSHGSSGTDTSYWSIQAQRYDAGGAPLGGEFQVNTYTMNFQMYPAVAMEGQGNFVVAWQSYGSSGTDNEGFSIQAQRYDASGAPFGEQFQVNTYTMYFQTYPAIGVDGRGHLVVAWQSDGSNGTDTSYTSIQARRYDANGSPLSGEFQVNTYTTHRQQAPAVAVDGQGNLIVAWHSVRSSGTDTDGYSIHAQRFDELFRDGVESGDTARWSVIAP